MYYVPSSHKEYLAFSEAGGMPCWEYYFDSSFRRTIADDRTGILMDFTGLLDKNKKEIYEGDVLKAMQHETGNILKDVVEWKNGAYFMRYADHDFSSKWVENAEIIGNIYENPNILKEREVK